MARPSLKPSDVLAALVAIGVFGYFVVVRVELITGGILAAWALGIHWTLRSGNREHAAVVIGLGALVIVGYLSGSVLFYLTTLIVAGFAYTIWTLKYAPERHESA